MAISTARGRKLLKAKGYRGVWGQEKAIYFSQHFIKETSRVTPLKQVTSYISPYRVDSLSGESEQCPPAQMKWTQPYFIPAVPTQIKTQIMAPPPEVLMHSLGVGFKDLCF